MRLKVVMTLGPSSAVPEVLVDVMAVADKLRLNTAHLTIAELDQWLMRLAEMFRGGQARIPVVLDLQGAKMRLGDLPALEALPPQVELVCADRGQSDGAVLGVPHPELFAQVREGEPLWLQDGRLRLRVRSVAPDRLTADVEQNGPVRGHQGINRPRHPIVCRELSPPDRAMIERARDVSGIQFALSFVHTGAEAELLRAVTERPIIAKIERAETLAHLSRLDSAFDELWLCRGDLGAQAGLGRLGPLQETFAAQLSSFRHGAYLAGQVLHHMTVSPQPTRTEVVQLHQVARAGWTGIVLSDETAIGQHPRAVCEWVRELIHS